MALNIKKDDHIKVGSLLTVVGLIITAYIAGISTMLFLENREDRIMDELQNRFRLENVYGLNSHELNDNKVDYDGK